MKPPFHSDWYHRRSQEGQLMSTVHIDCSEIWCDCFCEADRIDDSCASAILIYHECTNPYTLPPWHLCQGRMYMP